MGNLIQGGFNAVAAYNQSESQKAVTAAQHVVNDAQVYGQNTVGQAQVDAANLLGKTQVANNNATRLAQNAIVAANAAAANSARSAGNYQRVTAIGNKADTLTTNMVRTAQGMVKGTVDARIRSAEQLGALTAQASAAGIGGGSVAALKSALNIQTSRDAEAADQKRKDLSYDGLVQRAGLQSQAATTLDLNQTIANINYTQDVYTDQIFSPGIAPIVPGDFAPDSGTAATMAFFGGTDWNKTINQGIDLLNSKSVAQTPTTTGFEADSYGYGGTGTKTYETASTDPTTGLFGASQQ